MVGAHAHPWVQLSLDINQRTAFDFCLLQLKKFQFHFVISQAVTWTYLCVLWQSSFTSKLSPSGSCNMKLLKVVWGWIWACLQFFLWTYPTWICGCSEVEPQTFCACLQKLPALLGAFWVHPFSAPSWLSAKILPAIYRWWLVSKGS